MKQKTLIDFRMHKASGIGRYISNIVPHLVNAYDIVLLGNKSDIMNTYPWALNVEIIECNAKIYSIKEQLELFLKIPKCDIFWSPHYNIPLLPIRAKKRVVTVHDMYHLEFWDTLTPAQKIYAWIFLNCAVKFSDAILTVSNFSKSQIYKYIKTAKPINVIGCAVDNFTNYQNSIASFPFEYILYVGNVKPHKNLQRAIKAYKILDNRFKSIKFVIVGAKDSFITNDFESSQIQDDDIVFTGRISDDELGVVYANAKALIFISLYEGFGIPPLEAQSYKCPVLASTCASIPEVCSDSVLYCDAYSVDDIKAKIEMILEQPHLRDNLIQAGLNNIKRFSWYNSAKQVKEILESLK